MDTIKPEPIILETNYLNCLEKYGFFISYILLSQVHELFWLPIHETTDVTDQHYSWFMQKRETSLACDIFYYFIYFWDATTCTILDTITDIFVTTN